MNALNKGIEVELEHRDLITRLLKDADRETSEKNIRLIAAEIAKDHLKEDPDYYNKLEQVEKERKPMDVQSFIFSKEKFTLPQAKSWLKDHGHKTSVDETEDSYRFRQKEPGSMDKFRTIEIDTGIKAVVGKSVEKEMPTRSQVHVDSPIGSRKEKITLKSKNGTIIEIDDMEESAEANPPLNNIGKADGENDVENPLFDIQQIIEGMDWELRHSTKDPEQARDTAIEQLNDDPYFYKKLKLVPRENYIDNNGSGFNIDLGSGIAREDGHIGFDVYPFDHGTIVHDLEDGIPLSDGSVRKVRAINSLHEITDDPKILLSEIHRVLMPGGQFEYQGPEEIYNYPDWHKQYPSLELVSHEDNAEEVKKIEGNPTFRQIFTRLAVPDAAASNDAEPRTGVAQYDMLPADALLAMDAMGYFWSDSTSSGKGNRLHGYASQGALVKKSMKKIVKITKADKYRQIVYGVVLAPDEVDFQDDYMSAQDIEDSAHSYLIRSRIVGGQHEKKADAEVVESYIAPQDLKFEGQNGPQIVKKGSWVMAVKINDPGEWQKVLDGEYTGFSVGGRGERE